MTETAPTSRRRRVITVALLVLIPLSLAAASVWRIVHLEPTDRFFDDFFYYIDVARNWTSGQGSTFFPNEPTNGYHPLWFLWLSALLRLCGSGSLFFALVDLSITALLIAFFFLYRAFLNRVTGHDLAAVIGAGIAVVAIAPRAMWGLEMALVACAAAAVLAFLARYPMTDDSPRNGLIAGVLVCVMVLARLDSAVLLPGIIVAAFWTASAKNRWGFAVGLAPILGYAMLNLVQFGRIETTSMAAKSLSTYLPPNWHIIATESPFPGAREILVGVAMVTVFVLIRRHPSTVIRRLSIALASAPALQLFAQLVFSGWSAYPWYWYFDLMTIGLAAALVLARVQQNRHRVGVTVVAVLLLLAAYPLSFQGGQHPNRDIAQLTAQLRTFAAEHPGIYAMGDAAGTPGWLIGRPIVHLEGLMMSPQFLDRIRQGQPLTEVFRDYRVSYYVAVRPSGPESTDGCLRFAEPAASQSSPRAPHLTADVCGAPISVLTVGDRYRVRIYRVDPATGAIG